jgi:hypothetical protein
MEKKMRAINITERSRVKLPKLTPLSGTARLPGAICFGKSQSKNANAQKAGNDADSITRIPPMIREGFMREPCLHSDYANHPFAF